MPQSYACLAVYAVSQTAPAPPSLSKKAAKKAVLESADSRLRSDPFAPPPPRPPSPPTEPLAVAVEEPPQKLLSVDPPTTVSVCCHDRCCDQIKSARHLYDYVAQKGDQLLSPDDWESAAEGLPTPHQRSLADPTPGKANCYSRDFLLSLRPKFTSMPPGLEVGLKPLTTHLIVD